MIGDHHHRTAARATLLVTAADEILGTHRRLRSRFLHEVMHCGNEIPRRDKDARPAHLPIDDARVSFENPTDAFRVSRFDALLVRGEIRWLQVDSAFY